MAAATEKKDLPEDAGAVDAPLDAGSSQLINASGHVQELDRNFNLLSAAGVGLVVGSASSYPRMLSTRTH
jgi:hypothetical protein